MRLSRPHVENYRGISDATVDLHDVTVLLGPNNEGKSTILGAVALVMAVLRQTTFEQKRGEKKKIVAGDVGDLIVGETLSFDWHRDFPMSLQDAQPDGACVFNLVIDLSQDECDAFENEVGSKLDVRQEGGNLPVELRLLRAGIVELRVTKKGRGAGLVSKVAEISQFLRSRLDVQYIGAIRTADAALGVVRTLVERDLSRTESDERLLDALAVIEEVRRPVLEQLGEDVLRALQPFLPNLRTVSFDGKVGAAALRSQWMLYLDDGSRTELHLKGDGVKSLAALALLQHAATETEGVDTLLALEEPESHLHPEAVRQLRSVVHGIGERQQVVLSTHSPLLVDRVNVSHNVIVEAGNATAATSLKDIRATLGIRPEDSLSLAETLLVVEGDDDAIVLKHVLAQASAVLADAIATGRLAIVAAGGAGKISYLLRVYRDFLFDTHVWVDDDTAGRTAIEKAKNAQLLTDAQFNVGAIRGMRNSELEDFLVPTAYVDAIAEQFGVTLTGATLTSRRACWSDRVRRAFVDAGKIWDDAVEAHVKAVAAEATVRFGGDPVEADRRSPLDSLIQAMERRVVN